MIRVTVELMSAIDGSTTELARMIIANDGDTTTTNPRLGSYVGATMIGRNTAALDRGTVSKRGKIINWRRQDFHVWNLVRRMLETMGYDK